MALSSILVAERRAAAAARARLSLVERRRILILGDLIAATVAGGLALLVWYRMATGADSVRPQWMGILAAGWIASALLLGSYIPPYLHRTMRSWGLLVATAGLVLATYSAIYFFAPREQLPRVVVLAFVGASVAIVGGWRRLWDWASGHDAFRRPILIVGAGRLGETLANILGQRPHSGYAVLGFVDDDPNKQAQEVKSGPWSSHRVLGRSRDLVSLVGELGVQELVLALRSRPQTELVEAVLACHERGIVVSNASDLYETTTGRLPTWHIGDNWGEVLPLAHPGGHALYLAAKRTLDIIGATVGLAVLGLLLPALAIAIKLDSKGGAFYRQPRTGRGGHHFWIWKLRTMTDDPQFEDGPKWAMQGDPRVTRVGRWLRRTHIDELPQLWNVLKGEMSLVGPRPDPVETYERLGSVIPFYRLRAAVKPGLAGWGAINGGYVNGDEQAVARIEYDLYYIKHQSIWLDLQIIANAAHRALAFRGY